MRAAYLRLDVDAERGNVGLDANVAVSQRAREMYESLGSGGHAGRECVRRFDERSVGEREVWAEGARGLGVEVKIEASAALQLGPPLCVARDVAKFRRFCDLQVWRAPAWGCAHLDKPR